MRARRRRSTTASSPSKTEPRAGGGRDLTEPSSARRLARDPDGHRGGADLAAAASNESEQRAAQPDEAAAQCRIEAEGAAPTSRWRTTPRRRERKPDRAPTMRPPLPRCRCGTRARTTSHPDQAWACLHQPSVDCCSPRSRARRSISSRRSGSSRGVQDSPVSSLVMMALSQSQQSGDVIGEQNLPSWRSAYSVAVGLPHVGHLWVAIAPPVA